MSLLRVLLRDYRHLALLLLGLVACARLLVPEGFMPAPERGVLAIRICHDGTSGQLAQLLLPAPEQAPQDGDEPRKQGQMCSFASSLGGALDSALPSWLAAVFALVLLLGFAPVVPARARALARLRPPLRGPPLFS